MFITEFVYANTIVSLQSWLKVAFRVLTSMPPTLANILPLFTSISENIC